MSCSAQAGWVNIIGVRLRLTALAAFVFPDHFAVSGFARENPSDDKQQVGKAIEIANRLGAHGIVSGQGDYFALSSQHAV